MAIHLYGSALDGGLQPYSDVDLLVTVQEPLDTNTRQALLLELLHISAYPGTDDTLRALEVTIIVYPEVVPWHYPPVRELQFGEWLREDLLRGIFEPAVQDMDLAILLTKVRRHSVPVLGQVAEKLFEPVPVADFRAALADTVKQWNIASDWAGDERNIILTLARIWYSAETGNIAPKHTAAKWLMERVPTKYHPLLQAARDGYLGKGDGMGDTDQELIADFVLFSKEAISSLLKSVG